MPTVRISNDMAGIRLAAVEASSTLTMGLGNRKAGTGLLLYPLHCLPNLWALEAGLVSGRRNYTEKI